MLFMFYFFKILSEIFLVSFVSRILIQSSALWMSLLLVPSSGLLMLSWMELSNFSGMVVMVIILVFIGGLLILLVGVSSTMSQEQDTSSSVFFISWGIPFSIFLVLLETKIPSNSFQVFLFSWLSWGLTTLYLICSVLVFSLSLMTWLTISFKGSLRGL